MNQNEKSPRAAQPPERQAFHCKVRDWFRRFAQVTSEVTGSAWAFMTAIGIIVVWGMTGPTFHYSDTWQLIINTGTTIVTFLMVFLIQNTQNRDAKAIHLKLDELIRSQKGARNELVDLEKLSDDELKKLEKEFARMRENAPKGSTKVVKVEEIAEAEEEIEKAAEHTRAARKRVEAATERQ
jgi:low affinity Fe/Cu permease